MVFHRFLWWCDVGAAVGAAVGCVGCHSYIAKRLLPFICYNVQYTIFNHGFRLHTHTKRWHTHPATNWKKNLKKTGKIYLKNSTDFMAEYRYLLRTRILNFFLSCLLSLRKCPYSNEFHFIVHTHERSNIDQSLIINIYISKRIISLLFYCNVTFHSCGRFLVACSRHQFYACRFWQRKLQRQWWRQRSNIEWKRI